MSIGLSTASDLLELIVWSKMAVINEVVLLALWRSANMRCLTGRDMENRVNELVVALRTCERQIQRHLSLGIATRTNLSRAFIALS